MKVHRFLVPLILAPLAACSTFAPVDRATVVPGEAIRVELTSEQTAAMADELGGFRESLTGTVQELDDGGVGLTISAVQDQAVQMAQNFRSYIYLPWNGVTRVERRQFSPLRSGLLVAGGAAAAWAILELTTGSGGVGEEGGNTNNGLVSVPIFGFAF